MKNCIVIIFLIIIGTAAGYSQTDTLVIIKTDSVFVQEKHDLMYKFFLETREQETNHLWKTNLVDIGLGRLNVGYEHRLGKEWSVEGYVSYGMLDSDLQISLGNTTFYPFYSYEKTVIEQLFKYYYNLNRRRKLGKKAHGFRGNYFASSFLYHRHNDPPSSHNGTPSSPDIQWIVNYSIGIKYGLQRRIGNLGYFELYFGIYYRWESVSKQSWGGPDYVTWTEHDNAFILNAGFKLGFAIDSFNSLKRMKD